MRKTRHSWSMERTKRRADNFLGERPQWPILHKGAARSRIGRGETTDGASSENYPENYKLGPWSVYFGCLSCDESPRQETISASLPSNLVEPTVSRIIGENSESPECFRESEGTVMKRKSLSFVGRMVAACGMLALAGASAHAQMRPGMGQAQQPNMQQQNPNMQPNNMMANQQMNQQDREQMDFVANIRRNSKVETDLSKMALKNSSSDPVKQFAYKVIAVNRKNDSLLEGANPQMSSMMFPAPVPAETRKAEKQMKKTTGSDFDKLYIGQMDGYIKNDQKLTTDAASAINSGNLAAVTMQLRNTADERMKELTQVAQSENLKLR